MHYQVKLPLREHTDWFTLCDCDSVESLLEVVRILAQLETNHASEIKIDCLPGAKYSSANDQASALG